MAPTGQRETHTPQSMQASESTVGAAPSTLLMASAGQTAGLRSAGKSGIELEITSASEYDMHGAVGHRKHDDCALEPSEKETIPGRPGATLTATGCNPGLSARGAAPVPLWREKIRDIRNALHFSETLKR